MKVYISADLEGVSGTTNWDEVTKGNGAAYPQFQKQMTAEVCAACRGAFGAGAKEIVIRDAHDTAANLLAEELPENTTLIRGWSRHPYMMMQELDTSFDAVMMIGYHSLAGGGGNPLSHTMSTRIAEVTVNGVPTSEFLINYYTSLYESVPVVMISGDGEICEHATTINESIHTAAVKKGTGASTINLHPKTAVKMIEKAAKRSLQQDVSSCLTELPREFEVEIIYNHAQEAFKISFFPGAELIGARNVRFFATNYFEVLKFFLFAF